MDASTFEAIKLIVEAVALAIGGALAILWAVRNGWFKLQQDTVRTYKDSIESLERKVTDLEDRMRALEDKNKQLAGEVEGKDMVIGELVQAISESGLCQRAWDDCADRIIPIDGAGRRKRTP